VLRCFVRLVLCCRQMREVESADAGMCCSVHHMYCHSWECVGRTTQLVRIALHPLPNYVVANSTAVQTGFGELACQLAGLWGCATVSLLS
jgi:hypothetical protein